MVYKYSPLLPIRALLFCFCFLLFARDTTQKTSLLHLDTRSLGLNLGKTCCERLSGRKTKYVYSRSLLLPHAPQYFPFV